MLASNDIQFDRPSNFLSEKFLVYSLTARQTALAP